MNKITPADKVYNYIKEQIVTRRLYPGNRIIEEDVVEAVGVSRTPIRTALSRALMVSITRRPFLTRVPALGFWL
ncbi:MAG: GntR family transcriptional regulator [Firmicutes bacterium]|nr:GntR family transcriptional regulator [Bacillota bacterium]